ncbi:MAG: hypothetical protein ACPF8V_11600 [Luteibaculum sp.]
MIKLPSNKRALVISILFHVVLLIIFLFVGLTQPDPLPKEIGVEIAMADYGTSFTGQGDTPSPQPQPTEDPTPAQTTPTAVQNTAAPQEQVVQEDVSDIATPTSTKKTEKKEKTEEKPEPVKEVQPQRQVNQRALYPGKQNDNPATTGGGSQGNREGKGDAGSEEGKPQGKGILGGGMGSWELSGRSLVKGTTIEDTKEEGTVVLNIWVDRYGNVTRTAPNLAESNTTSQYLFDLAASAAKQSKYSSKSDAAVEQKGKMTFKFILE